MSLMDMPKMFVDEEAFYGKIAGYEVFAYLH